MQRHLFILLLVILFCPAIASAVSLNEWFEIKPKPGGVMPTITVSAGADKTRYSETQVAPAGWSVEVRGGFKHTAISPYNRVYMAGIEYGLPSSLQHYKIGVSGDHASLTGNNGNKWEAHLITSNIFGDLQSAIDMCNSGVTKDVANGLTQTQALNKSRTFEISKNDSPYLANLKISPANINFYEVWATTKLPYRVSCVPTGYKKPAPTSSNSLGAVANVEESHLTILEQASHISGVCKVTLSGVIKTNLPNTTVKFQYEHTNGNKSDIKTVTTSHSRNAMFAHTYSVDNNPYDDEAGSIRIVGVSHPFHSAWKTYSMRCEDAATNDLQTETPPQLSIQVRVSQTEMIKGQICPKQLQIQGKVKAGSSLQGHAVFIGSGSTSYQSDEIPFALHIGDSKTFTRLRQVALPNTLGSLQAIDNGAPVLKSISITQGMSIMDSNNQMIASTGQKSFTFDCHWPQINPGLQGSGTLGMSPDHTGGGGAPTSLKATSPFSRADNSEKVTNAGLRSDGELVQARKPMQLQTLNTDLVRQQGRMLTDTDTNKSTQQKSHIADQSDQNSVNNAARVWPPGQWKQSGFQGKGNDSTTTKDRNLGKQKADQPEPQPYSIPMQNATVGSVRAPGLNNKQSKRATLFQGNVGQPCNRSSFPQHSVVRQAGQQHVVECTRGKVTISPNKKVTQPWKPGDPVFKATGTHQQPVKKIKGNSFSDEMPDDLPAG